MRLQAYFDRIGYGGDARPDLPSLCALLRAHICAIPFENLDVQLGRPLTTDPAAAYEKIVGNGRGGWCYEHNGLFGAVLSEIGFEVTRIAAAVMRQDRGDAATANHLCLLVRCGGSKRQYFVDVGFGGSMIEPVPFEESEWWQPPYRIGVRSVEDDHWRFWEDSGEGEFTFDFVPEPASEAALADKCRVLQTDPNSSFVLNLVAQLRAIDRHTVLRGRVLTTITSEGTTRTTLQSAGELVATLADVFHLHVPEARDLWPNVVARHGALFGGN